MDVCLAVLPWKILWNLQMRTAEKIGAGVAMNESYNSIIWAVAECSMAIVATSIPVLRVIFRQAFNSAMEGYTGQSKSKSRSNPSNAGSSGNRLSTRQLSKKTPDISVSGESVKEVFGRGSRGSKNYVELDDLVVDEATGRATASSLESLANDGERHVLNWHV
ncbi:hypothetical protein J4E86_008821 [Alternaria arbusti]|uniref:uncharacterized protein n=2 Tax=Alternaria sect. Infectoriae TaxID=2499258 RepID=UPI00221FC034|nr:uncharacterized protein J4E86_008821 [Alternaria arbusti]KAI4947196.1 hypothetical protein J4E86_008821 [Alternaria arbusti]